jgi:transcriptional regulator with XRE-family HTH domain
MTNNPSSKSSPRNFEAGQALRNLCLSAGYDQRRFAQESEIRESTLTRLFSGETGRPNVDTTVKIVFGISMAQKKDFEPHSAWRKVLEIYQKSKENKFRYSDSEINEISSRISHRLNGSRELNSQGFRERRTTENFVGRNQEIADLIFDRTAPNSLHQTRWPIIIAGIGGLGKTTLVLEVAHRCLEYQNNPEVPRFEKIIYTTAKRSYLEGDIISPKIGHNFTLISILEEISKALNKDILSHSDDLGSQLRDTIDALGEYRTLLIIDNLETIEGQEVVIKFINDILRSRDTVTILITTRSKAKWLFEPCKLDLKKLNHEETLELIDICLENNRYPRQLTEQERQVLCRITDGIPLAVKNYVGLLGRGHSVSYIERRHKKGQGNLTKFLFEECVNDLKNSEDLKSRNSYKLLLAMSILADPLRRDAIIKIAGLEEEDSDDISDSFIELIDLFLISRRDDGPYEIESSIRGYAETELRSNQELYSLYIQNQVKYYVEFVQAYGKRDLDEWERGNWVNRYNVINEQWGNIEAVINYCATRDKYIELKTIWEAIHSFTEVYGRWFPHKKWLKTLADQANSNADDCTFVFALSARARVFIRTNSDDALRQADELLDQAENRSKDLNLPIAVRVELFENRIMLLIERGEYERSQANVNELEAYLNQQDLEHEQRIHYMLTVKYPQRSDIF